MISEEYFQSILDDNAPADLHLDTEIRRICHIIATTKADIEENPHGDYVLLEPDTPDEQPYYYSARSLVLEDCDIAIADRAIYISSLEFQAFAISNRAHKDYLGIPYDEEADYEEDED